LVSIPFGIETALILVQQEIARGGLRTDEELEGRQAFRRALQAAEFIPPQKGKDTPEGSN